jgi:PAS domain S-box-containing protein
MKQLKYFSLCVFFIAFFISEGYAQIPAENIVVASEDDGISHISISSIYKASDGYLWIGTIEGLNRFNGRNFKHYTDKLPENQGLTNNNVRVIDEDKNGNIWVGTTEGLNKYRPKTDDFKSYTFFDDAGSATGYSTILALAPDNNILWVGTSSGLLRFNMATENYSELNLGDDYEASIIFNDILDLKNDGKYLWIGTKLGLYRYDKNSKKVINFNKSKLFENEISGKRVNHIRIDSSGSLWLSTNKGISRLKKEGNRYTVENYTVSLNDEAESSVRDFYYTEQINDSTVITGTIVSGLFSLNLKNKVFKEFRLEGIDNIKTKSHYFDSEHNILWIGALNTGLIKINPGRKPFTSKVFYDRTDRLSSFFIFCEDKDNSDIIWAGTTTGLLRYNRKTQQFSTYYISFNNDIGYTIRALQDNGKGKLYIGTHDKGLYVFDKNSGNVLKHKFSLENPEYGIVHSLLYKDEKLYIGASNILFVYGETKEDISRYQINADPEESLQAIFALNQDELLIGSYASKISVFNTKQNTITKISAQPNPNDDVNCGGSVIYFSEYKNDKLLLGTYGNGICVFDKETKTIYKEDSLEVGYNAIYGVIQDENGGLWASSNYGLLHYSKTTDSWITFRKSDGLQGNEFNIGALLETSDGEIFVGGNNGFNHFYPTDIFVKKEELPLFLEQLRLFNKVIHPGDSVKGDVIIEEALRFCDTLYLSYYHNFISIRFAAVDFLNPDELQYRYKLEGFNDEWVYTDRKNNTAVFTNLSSGKYTFIVQAKSKFSDYKDNQTQLYIIVKPPFWQTPIFYFLLVLTLVLLSVGYVKLRERKLRIEKKKLEQLVDLRTVEIRQARNDFELEKEFADAIIEISPEGIAVFDIHGVFMRVNPALCRILNYSASELVGTNIRELTPPEWAKQLKEDIDEVNKGASVVLETEMVRKDGTHIDIRLSSARIADTALVAVITDISERKIAEYKAEQYRAELEKQVRERTNDYKKAKEKAETADQLKTAFLANMSHEIRTPLNAILGFAQLLNDDDISKKQIANYTDLIQRGGNSLLHLINDIIDLAKIESNQLTIEKEDFSVNELTDEVFQMFLNAKENLQNGEVDLRMHIPAHDVVLYSDRDRIKQVLINLLNNANKFTDSGHIEIGYEQIIIKGKVFLNFYVQDTGSGIPQDKLEKIFSRFTKFDKKSTRVLKGAGLGLAISKRIVELLGGHIGVDSEQDKGSVFHFTIPL